MRGIVILILLYERIVLFREDTVIQKKVGIISNASALKTSRRGDRIGKDKGGY